MLKSLSISFLVLSIIIAIVLRPPKNTPAKSKPYPSPGQTEQGEAYPEPEGLPSGIMDIPPTLCPDPNQPCAVGLFNPDNTCRWWVTLPGAPNFDAPNSFEVTSGQGNRFTFSIYIHGYRDGANWYHSAQWSNPGWWHITYCFIDGKYCQIREPNLYYLRRVVFPWIQAFEFPIIRWE